MSKHADNKGPEDFRALWPRLREEIAKDTKARDVWARWTKAGADRRVLWWLLWSFVDPETARTTEKVIEKEYKKRVAGLRAAARALQASLEGVRDESVAAALRSIPQARASNRALFSPKSWGLLRNHGALAVLREYVRRSEGAAPPDAEIMLLVNASNLARFGRANPKALKADSNAFSRFLRRRRDIVDALTTLPAEPFARLIAPATHHKHQKTNR